MDIQINTTNTVEGSETITERLETSVRDHLSRFSDRLTRVEVHLDEAGGQADRRCMIEARPAGLLPISVTDQAGTLDQATTGALAKMTTALERSLGKMTDRKGH